MLDDKDEFEKLSAAEMLRAATVHEVLHAVHRRQHLWLFTTDVYTNLVVPHPSDDGAVSPPVIE